MVKLTRIYTKTGDKGTTSLANGKRVKKTDLRIDAVADIDETNSAIGVVVSMGPLLDNDVKKLLLQIQNDLFDCGADLATPFAEDERVTRIPESAVTYIERQIDKYNTPLNPLMSFVLPSGTYTASLLHVARTVARRAERAVWRCAEEQDINLQVAKYMNRLSDLLFVLARYENRTVGDTLWVPTKRTNEKSPD